MWYMGGIPQWLDNDFANMQVVVDIWFVFIPRWSLRDWSQNNRPSWEEAPRANHVWTSSGFHVRAVV